VEPVKPVDASIFEYWPGLSRSMSGQPGTSLTTQCLTRHWAHFILNSIYLSVRLEAEKCTDEATTIKLMDGGNGTRTGMGTERGEAVLKSDPTNDLHLT